MMLMLLLLLLLKLLLLVKIAMQLLDSKSCLNLLGCLLAFISLLHPIPTNARASDNLDSGVGCRLPILLMDFTASLEADAFNFRQISKYFTEGNCSGVKECCFPIAVLTNKQRQARAEL